MTGSVAAQIPSDRSFGRVFTIVFALSAGYLLWRGNEVYVWAFVLTALTATVTAVKPGLLAPLNRAWMSLGALLHHVTSPIVLGALFFGLFTPIGVVMRAFGRDALKRRFDAEASSYWIEREPPGPAADTFRDQF